MYNPYNPNAFNPQQAQAQQQPQFFNPAANNPQQAPMQPAAQSQQQFGFTPAQPLQPQLFNPAASFAHQQAPPAQHVGALPPPPMDHAPPMIPAQQEAAPLPPPPSDEDFEGGSLKPQAQQQQQQYHDPYAAYQGPYGAPQQQQPPMSMQTPPSPSAQQYQGYQANQQQLAPPPAYGYPQQQQQVQQPPQQQQYQYAQQQQYPQQISQPAVKGGEFGDDPQAKLSLQPSQQQAAFMAQTMVSSNQIDSLPRPTPISFSYEIPQPDVSPLFERKNQASKVDMSKAQASARFLRPTVQCVPNAPNILAKWALPFGAVIHPFAEGEDIPVVNQGANGIVRCFQCRTYINPFCVFLDGGRKWQCNICKKINDVPNDYYCQLDEFGQRKDIAKRPELRCGSVDFLAPTEYMARVPQPPAYLFVIDVSYPAIASGMTRLAAKTIKKTLSKLPGDVRTRVGIITFDSTIHFYNLKPSLSQPQMLVVGELQESLLPIPSDLLVNLDESKSVIETLLDRLSTTMFKNTTIVDSCLGAVLNSAGRILGRVGGKLLLFVANLPTLGPNALKNRETPNIYGSENEHSLLQATTPNYKDIALLYSRDQICVDMFVTADQYVDIATLSALAKFTGGQIFHYPSFKLDMDGPALKNDLKRVLTRETGFEAVMRVRVSAGLKVTNFYGNFFIRSHDLLALPNIDADKTFGVEVAHAGNFLSTPNASIQAAVLYTSSAGERRIRVHTITLPISSSLADMYKFADIDASLNLLSKIAADEAPRLTPPAIRNKLRDITVNSLRTYRQEVSKAANSNQLILPDSLRLLPLYACALAKNEAFMGGAEVKADERIAAMARVASLSVPRSAIYIHPTLYSVQDYAELLQQVNNQEVLPNKLLPLSKQFLYDNGVYVLDDSHSLYVWIGKQVAADNESLNDVIRAVQVVNSSKLLNNVEEHPASALGQTLIKLIVVLRKRCNSFVMARIATGENLKRFYLKKLMEDKNIPSTMGYDEFLKHVHQQINGMK